MLLSTLVTLGKLLSFSTSAKKRLSCQKEVLEGVRLGQCEAQLTYLIYASVLKAVGAAHVKKVIPVSSSKGNSPRVISWTPGPGWRVVMERQSMGIEEGKYSNREDSF